MPLPAPGTKAAGATANDRVMHGKEGTAMQAFMNTLSDVEIAAVITYERNLSEIPRRFHPARTDQGIAIGVPA